MRKTIASVLLALAVLLPLSANGTREEGIQAQQAAENQMNVLASTSWTAAFADLAGVDSVDFLAPASLRHPPEYELVPSDIVRVKNADVIVAAGYEKMMETIADSLAGKNTPVVKITTENSIEKVTSETAKIAAVTGTTPRLDSYIKTVEDGRAMVAASSQGKRVYCHKMQTPLAEDLGLEIVGTFGPAPVNAEQIAFASQGDFDFIIDNVHNPITGPFKEVTGKPVVTWRNFPAKVEKGALEKVVKENIEALKAVL